VDRAEPTTASSIGQRLLQKDRQALARAISWAENDDPRFASALEEIYGRVGGAWRIGITGPPGAGKSTLTHALTEVFRAEEKTVAVLAVDPSSPLTGGALLGDRIRMEASTLDPGVFIRSMASRGSRGGLARAAIDACDCMDAFGFDVILVETVGVGQSEYTVMQAVDTVLVVLCPGAGDGIQAMKAGLLEVAHVLVVNKADQPGADRLALDLEDAVRTRLPRKGRDGPEVSVVSCSALRAQGIAEVHAAARAHRASLEGGQLEQTRRRRRAQQVMSIVSDRLLDALWSADQSGNWIAEKLDRASTPYAVARSILEPLLAAMPYSSKDR
jgi:LAO/AO transport system kinase